MPTYDYKCANCEHQWEEFQSITAKPLRKCPECGKLKAKRMIGPGAGIIFKGSGFYETDYRSSSYNKGAAADKKASESSSKSDSGSKSSDKSPKSDSGSSSKKSSD
ncbi:MAG: zinc ribbon domain-containing protein [Planctomycetota bacterium]|jgi:putative FmdB family regulatory protein|nr:zinc ribbon domain-containing protein [Planctomycetota bacterium]